MPTSLSPTCENARRNAITSANLPNLNRQSLNRCLEIYLDDIDCPAVVFFDGKLIYLGTRSYEQNCFQIMGDDGSLFIKVNGEVLLNRIQDYPLPLHGLEDIDQKISQLEVQLAQLKG
jgi:hypothetical protein